YGLNFGIGMADIYKITTLKKSETLHWFDYPVHEGSAASDGALRVAGWALSSESVTVLARNERLQVDVELKIKVARPDVVRALTRDGGIVFELKDDVCGFDQALPKDWRSFRLGLITGDKPVEWVAKVDIVSAPLPSASAKVIRGKYGWLFLDNDTNHSVKQFSG